MSSVPLDRPDGFAAWVLTSPDLTLPACVWPIAEGTAAIAGEIERGTLSWVLAAPVSRTSYLTARVAALLVGEALILAAGIALMLASAILDLVASVWAPLSHLRPLSLLSYFHPYLLLRGSSVETWVWSVPSIGLPVALAGAWWVFERRDLAL